MNYTCKFCLRIWCFKIQSIISKQLTHSCLGSNFLNWKRTHETSLHRKPCVNTQKLLYITFTKQKNVVPIHKFPWVHREFSVSTSVSHLQQPFDQLKLSCVRTPEIFCVDTWYFCISLCGKFYFSSDTVTFYIYNSMLLVFDLIVIQKYKLLQSNSNFFHFLSKPCICTGVFSGKQWLQNYLSFINIPAWPIQLSVELNLLK